MLVGHVHITSTKYSDKSVTPKYKPVRLIMYKHLRENELFIVTQYDSYVPLNKMDSSQIETII